MITNRELRTLRWQLLLTGGLFTGSLVLAIVIAVNRPYAESFIQEGFKLDGEELPKKLQQAADEAATGELAASWSKQLKPEDWRLLYEDWMLASEPRRSAAAAFSARNAEFFTEAAERTVVCGSDEQKRRAARFLEWSNSQAAIPVLQRLQRWTAKRNQRELSEQLAVAEKRLRESLE